MASERARKPAGQVRRHRLKASANDEEKADIEQLAAQVGSSLSSFMIKASRGCKLVPLVDQAAVNQLAEISANNGRLGGLFKAWLVQHPDVQQPLPVEMRGGVRALIRSIESTQVEMRTALKALVAELGRRSAQGED